MEYLEDRLIARSYSTFLNLLTKAAILAVEQAQHALAEGDTNADMVVDVGLRVMDYYRSRIQREEKTGDDLIAIRRIDAIER